MKPLAALACCAALGLLAISSARADSNQAHPCGTIGWMDEISILQADFERERGKEAMRTLFLDTLTDLLPELDARLALDRSTWTVRWQDQAPIAVANPNTDDLRDLTLAVTAPACMLLSQHDPEKAKRRLHGTWCDLWIDFEKVFIARLNDPAAAFGFSAISLSIKSPSVKSANESYSLQWMDREFGIARLFLPDMDDRFLTSIDEGLARLRTQAQIKTLILDLRDSGGGELRTIETLLARFLPSGTLAYSVRNRHGQETEVRVKENTSPEADRAIKLIVLTSQKTRGGAELLAGALQANGRAMVIGEPTAGMAGHKRVLKLSEKNFLILTDALPRFPGQTETSVRVTPNTEVPKSEAFNIALTTLAENGRLPANPFIRPDEHRHPLVQAVLDRNDQEALRLIEAGAELDIEASRNALDRRMPSHFRPRGSGETPVLGYPLAIAAAARGMPKVLAAIGQRVPELLHRTDTDGRTALAYAAMAGYPNTTRILLGHGLSPLHPAKQYPISETPLRLAVQLEEAEVVPLLMAAIPRDQLGHTAVIESVWIAAGFEKTAILKALLEAGASPNYIARQGGTALIEAVNDRNLEAVRLLLKHGATVDDHLYRGKSVFQYAEQQAERDSPKAREILELIRQAPKVDRGWQKSRDTKAMEDIWQMIENPEKFKGKPAP